MKISLESTVVASKKQIFSELDREAVIFNLKSGIYYGLDGVGVLVWELIQERRAVSDIRDTILKNYDVSYDQCQRDLVALLEELANLELIEIIARQEEGEGKNLPSKEVVQHHSRKAYFTPCLTVYGTVSELTK